MFLYFFPCLVSSEPTVIIDGSVRSFLGRLYFCLWLPVSPLCGVLSAPGITSDKLSSRGSEVASLVCFFLHFKVVLRPTIIFLLDYLDDLFFLFRCFCQIVKENVKKCLLKCLVNSHQQSKTTKYLVCHDTKQIKSRKF